MSTSPKTIEIILEAAADIPTIRARKMFGEYALYVDEKVVGLVCDDQLFIKITDASAALVRTRDPAPPYPGAKDQYRIDANDWDDREYITGLLLATADSLPVSKPKKPRKQK